MVDDLESWLEAKLNGVPEDLAREVRRLAAQGGTGGSETVVDSLARAALNALDEVAREDAARAEALPLLAADALLTYAFEAAAELGEDVNALASRIGPEGELGRWIAQALEGGGVRGGRG